MLLIICICSLCSLCSLSKYCNTLVGCPVQHGFNTGVFSKALQMQEYFEVRSDPMSYHLPYRWQQAKTVWKLLTVVDVSSRLWMMSLRTMDFSADLLTERIQDRQWQVMASPFRAQKVFHSILRPSYDTSHLWTSVRQSDGENLYRYRSENKHGTKLTGCRSWKSVCFNMICHWFQSCSIPI